MKDVRGGMKEGPQKVQHELKDLEPRWTESVRHRMAIAAKIFLDCAENSWDDNGEEKLLFAFSRITLR